MKPYVLEDWIPAFAGMTGLGELWDYFVTPASGGGLA